MNKGLEALYKLVLIKNYYYNHIPYNKTKRVFEDEESVVKTIEEELKRLEELENPKYDSEKKDLYWQISGLENKLSKQDKILRIIKEKRVDMNLLQNVKTVNAYNFYRELRPKLSKKNFDLLKEWLK